MVCVCPAAGGGGRRGAGGAAGLPALQPAVSGAAVHRAVASGHPAAHAPGAGPALRQGSARALCGLPRPLLVPWVRMYLACSSSCLPRGSISYQGCRYVWLCAAAAASALCCIICYDLVAPSCSSVTEPVQCRQFKRCRLDRRCAQELGKQNPELLSLINSNQAEFLRLINEPAPPGGEPGGGDLAAQLGGQLSGQLGEMLGAGAGGAGGARLASKSSYPGFFSSSQQASCSLFLACAQASTAHQQRRLLLR